MKLFHKFLLALLLVALVPLAIYSLILVNTTGRTLKRVINKNLISYQGNIALEVNKYFVDLDKKLDIPRQIEARHLSIEQQSQLVMTEMVNSKMFLGMYLLDSDGGLISGLSGDETRSTAVTNGQMLRAARSSGQVQIGRIEYAANATPSFDVIYPIDYNPREYLYMRVKLEHLLTRIGTFMGDDVKREGYVIRIIDDTGGVLATNVPLAKPISAEALRELSAHPQRQVFFDKGKICVATRSEGPGWLIVLEQPLRKAYGPVYQLQYGAILLNMLTLTCAVLVALRLAKQLTKPIATLISGIEIVAAGNMDYHVPQVSNDELSRLSTIFNDMTVKLKKLQEEMKKAERLSTIGQMANILGHEIRNPLAAITNAVYLIKWQVSKLPDVNPKVFKNIGVIEAEIKSTEKIINDMLDFSRQRPPVLSKQDLGEVVKSIMADAKVPENVKLTMDFAELPAVAIDIEEMKQVIRNLINNAIDSMVESPQRELILQTTPAALTKGTATVKAVKLDIIDTGCGIPPDTLARIWEPFFSTKSKGTGLGLAVVKRIVQERHNGAVEVHSICNKGTTFTVTLPII